MSKIRIMTILALLLLPVTMIYGQSSAASIDKSQLDNGVVNVSYTSSGNKATKVIIAKGAVKYTYDLNSNGQYPLQSGDGEYTISVLKI